MKLTDGRIPAKHIVFLSLAFCGYVINALYFNGFGTIAPVMMEFYQITPARQGLVLTMQSIGSLIMLVYMGLHGERYNKINLYSVATLLFGALCLVIGFALPYAVIIMLFLVSGGLASVTDVMVNGMIPELYPKQKNTLLPLLHAFFGVGAMVSPIIITTMASPDDPPSFIRPFLLIGALAVCLAVVFLIIKKLIIPDTPYADMSAVRKQVSDNPAEIFKTKKAWLLLGAGALYFSFQIGHMSWLPSYGQELGMDFSTSGSMLTAFFSGSLVMRFCSPLILRKITARKAYILLSLLGAAIVSAAHFMQNPSMMIALLAIGGFMQGSCVAFLVLMSADTFPHRVASASSLTFIAAGVAAMTAPLWMGAIAEHIGFRIPLLMVCALIAISAFLVSLVPGAANTE